LERDIVGKAGTPQAAAVQTREDRKQKKECQNENGELDQLELSRLFAVSGIHAQTRTADANWSRRANGRVAEIHAILLPRNWPEKAGVERGASPMLSNAIPLGVVKSPLTDMLMTAAPSERMLDREDPIWRCANMPFAAIIGFTIVPFEQPCAIHCPLNIGNCRLPLLRIATLLINPAC